MIAHGSPCVLRLSKADLSRSRTLERAGEGDVSVLEEEEEEGVAPLKI